MLNTAKCMGRSRLYSDASDTLGFTYSRSPVRSSLAHRIIDCFNHWVCLRLSVTNCFISWKVLAVFSFLQDAPHTLVCVCSVHTLLWNPPTHPTLCDARTQSSLYDAATHRYGFCPQRIIFGGPHMCRGIILTIEHCLCLSKDVVHCFKHRKISVSSVGLSLNPRSLPLLLMTLTLQDITLTCNQVVFSIGISFGWRLWNIFRSARASVEVRRNKSCLEKVPISY